MLMLLISEFIACMDDLNVLFLGMFALGCANLSSCNFRSFYQKTNKKCFYEVTSEWNFKETI